MNPPTDVPETLIASTADTIMNSHRFLSMEDTGEIYHYRGGAYAWGGSAVIREEAERLVRGCTTAVRDGIVEAVRSRTATPRSAFDSEPGLLCCQNRILDLRTLGARPHDHAPRRIQIGAWYDPDAGADPAYADLAGRVLGPAGSEVLHGILAASLLLGAGGTGRVPQTVMLTGPGEREKTAILGTIATFLGRRNLAYMSPEMLALRPRAVAALDGKILNMYDGLSVHTADSVRDAVDGLRPGGWAAATHKGTGEFAMRNTARMLFACDGVDGDVSGIPGGVRVIEVPDTGLVADGPVYRTTVPMTTPDEMSKMLNLLAPRARGLLTEDEA